MKSAAVMKSVLYIPKPPKIKINPNTLGRIISKDKIQFSSASSAELYAKNRVISALHKRKPFERAVILKDGLIFGETKGDSSSADTFNFHDVMENSTVIHGHLPESNGMAFPVSITDFLVMLTNKVKSLIAFDKNGNFSKLTAKKIKETPKTEKGLLDEKKNMDKIGALIVEKYAEEYVKLYPKHLRGKIQNSLHAAAGDPFGDKRKMFEYQINPFTIFDYLEMRDIDVKITKEGIYQKQVHDFWKKYAKYADCIYETNFSFPR